MSEVFWIGGAEAEAGAAAAVQRALARAGARVEWLERVYRLDQADTVPNELSLPATPPLLNYPPAPLLAQAALHDLTRSLQLLETDLALLLGGEAADSSAAVLASPRAIGRWNLLPDAQLSERLVFAAPNAGSLWPDLAQLLEQRGRAPDEIACLAFAQVDLSHEFQAHLPENLRRIAAANLVSALNQLVRALGEQQAALGLLLSARAGHACLATLVERV